MTGDDKKRPVEERIASLLGKSAYVDIRDGLGGTCPLRIRDQDIAAALGWVAQRVGVVGPKVLETHYASTLLHKDALRREWESVERGRMGPLTDRQIVLLRFAGEMAVRQMASTRYTTSHFADIAYLIHCRRDDLQTRTAQAAAWLEGIRATALSVLCESLRDRWEPRAATA